MAFDREARPARPARGNKRRKVCQFCAEKCESIDYKDAAKLRRFVSERSKILPRRTTGTCAMHQRQLTEAIKRARQIALLPSVTDGSRQGCFCRIKNRELKNSRFFLCGQDPLFSKRHIQKYEKHTRKI